MFKISSSFVVLLFLLVSCNKDGAKDRKKGDRGKDFCIKKVADDGCNICTFLKSSKEKPRKKGAKNKTERAKDELSWSCTNNTCTAEKAPGECLETRTRRKKD